MGLSVESSLLSFGTALDLGVSTLELDVQITADGHAMGQPRPEGQRGRLHRYRARRTG